MSKAPIGRGRFEVVLVEHERGWGPRIDEIRRFKTLKAAEAYVKKFNSHNSAQTVPDWYMVAEGPRIVEAK